jgi:hypothetical protein
MFSSGVNFSFHVFKCLLNVFLSPMLLVSSWFANADAMCLLNIAKAIFGSAFLCLLN